MHSMCPADDAVPLGDEPEFRPNTARPVLAFFDVDNTLLHGASVYHVSRAAWKRGYVKVPDLLNFAWHQARFVAVGENKKHIASVQERALGLAKGHPSDELKNLAEAMYSKELEPRLWAETVQIAREHLAKGHEVWLLTAAPDDIAKVIAAKLGFTGVLGSTLGAVDGKFTGELVGPMLHGALKADAAAELAAKLGADLTECWAYSDSHNDIPLLELVGNRIAINPDAGLRAHAKEHDWAMLTLDPSSIKAARKAVRRNAKLSAAAAPR